MEKGNKLEQITAPHVNAKRNPGSYKLGFEEVKCTANLPVLGVNMFVSFSFLPVV